MAISRFENVRLSSIVIKLTNLCNFNCPYCYMFNGKDISFKKRPLRISREIISKLVQRLAEYFKEYRIEKFTIVLHGGEPLLLGHKDFEFVLASLSELNNLTNLYLGMQTNGSLIDTDFLKIFSKYNLKVGISLDGPPSIQNQIKTKTGENTYPLIKEGIRKIREELGEQNFSGILSVINLGADPVEVYEHLVELGIKRMDFLFKHRNHFEPLGYDSYSFSYFSWLKQVFDCFMMIDDKDSFIRFLITIIDYLLEPEKFNSSLHHLSRELLTVETNGSLELDDNLRICGSGYANLGLNVFSNQIAEYYNHPKVHDIIQAELNLPDKCQKCEYQNLCQGGGLVFRYGQDQTFNWPSIYCYDNLALIDYIKGFINS